MRLGLICAVLATAAWGQDQCKPPSSSEPTHDVISPTRTLRRVVLSLTGTTPSIDQYEALQAVAPDGQQAVLDAQISSLLASPRFYEQMVKFGHEWIAVPAYTKGAQGDAYQGDMSGHLFTCGGSTVHAGALFAVNEKDQPETLCADTGVETHVVDPWWAPGKMVTVLGKAGGPVTTVVDTQGRTRDCGVAAGGYYDPELPRGCGCGPHLVWCAPLEGLNAGSNHDLINRQRRHPFEEPARLFAHLAWHDRPLTDLVVGNYSVGTNWLRALYVREARQQGGPDVTTEWWNAEADTSPRDPMHPTANDPQAWREFTVQDLNPFLLSRREYEFDPRKTTAAPEGLPAAGVLTMMGPLSAFPRERVRAARFLEIFGCSSFNPPPAGQTFPPYSGDPAKGGTCLHCHRALDPVAIYFKRWDFGADSYYVPWPFMPGVGRFRIGPEWVSGRYPHSAADSSAGFRWKNAFVPGTVMTPVTQAEATANTEALLLDTPPPDYTILGAHPDGTMGPLGFGKVLVSSGAFDRCAVRKIYARFVGRELEPAAEAAYLDRLVREFVARDRKLRPFIQYLFTEPEFRRGL